MSENQLHCRGIISAPLIKLLQTFESMAGARELISEPRQFGVSITDCFVASNDGIDGRFALCL